ncbi:MAG: hypothetical protein AAF202_00875, partial [Pseudomonadota bacterium]
MISAIRFSLIAACFIVGVTGHTRLFDDPELAKDSQQSNPSPFSSQVVPDGWAYTSLEDNPVQDFFPLLIGVFDHDSIPVVVVKLHESGDF